MSQIVDLHIHSEDAGAFIPVHMLLESLLTETLILLNQ